MTVFGVVRVGVPRALLLPLGVVFTILPSIFWAGSSDYAIQKVLQLVTVTPFAALAPVVLVHLSTARRFLWGILAATLVIVVFALVIGDTASSGRLVGGSGPIALGRVAGLGGVAVAGLFATPLVPPWIVLALLPLGLAAIGSGSYGPLGATAISVRFHRHISRPALVQGSLHTVNRRIACRHSNPPVGQCRVLPAPWH
jgi:hypothetical protein